MANENEVMDTDVTELNEELELDEYGRSEAERTIVLSPEDFELVMREMQDGKHDTYAEAHSYQLTRGRAEIKRQRDTAQKQDDIRKNAKALAKFNEILAAQPKLAQDPKELIRLLKLYNAYTGNVKSVLSALGINENGVKAVPPQAK